MKFWIYLLLVIALYNGLTRADSTKLSVCGAARAVPTKTQNASPACVNPPLNDFPTASLNAAAFGMIGARCGQCFELTGPGGKTVVMVVDNCNSGEACTQSDLFQFIIQDDQFNKISGNSSVKGYGNIYSLGFQIVSCGYEGNIKATFSGPNATPQAYSYFFSVIFQNNNVAVKSVQVKGTGMVKFESLKVQNGRWDWNKNNNELFFPAVLLIVSNTGEQIRYNMDSKPIAKEPIDIGSQFVPKETASLESSECGMALLPEFVYDESTAYGWNDAVYMGKADLKSTDTKDGSGTSIKAELDAFGGVMFKRDGGFQTQFLEKLSFDIKSSVETSALAVFFGDNENPTSLSQTVGIEWSTIELDVKSLTSNPAESQFQFKNNQNVPLTFTIDNVKWLFTTDAPIDEPTMKIIEVNNKAPSTGGSTTGASSTAGTSGISDDSSLNSIATSNSESGDNNENTGKAGGEDSNDSNTLIPSFIFISFILLLISFF